MGRTTRLLSSSTVGTTGRAPCASGHAPQQRAGCTPSPAPTRCRSRSSPATSRRPACWGSPYAATTSPRAPTRWMPGFKVFRSLVPNPSAGTTRQHLRPAGAELHLGRLHLPARQPLPLRLPPAQGDAEEPRPLGDAADPDHPHRGACTASGTTCSSTAASRAARPTPSSTATPRSRTSTPTGRSRRSAGSAATWTTPCCGSSTRPSRATRCWAASTSSPTSRPPTALKNAIDRGVDVRLVVDGKENGTRRSPAFPRDENLATLARTRASPTRTTRLRRGAEVGDRAQQVHGPHPRGIRPDAGLDRLDEPHARGYRRADERRPLGPRPGDRAGVPGLLEPAGRRPRRPRRRQRLGRPGEEQGVPRRRRGSCRPVPADLHDVPVGVTPVFSPRRTTAVLDSYDVLLDTAAREGCITFAFGVGAGFKELLQDNTSQNAHRVHAARDARQARPRRPDGVRAHQRRATTSTRRGGRSWRTRSTSGPRRRTPGCSASTSTSATCTRSSC